LASGHLNAECTNGPLALTATMHRPGLEASSLRLALPHNYLLAMALDNIPIIPPLHYQRIDLIFRNAELQALPYEVQHRLNAWLLARIAANTPPAPAPTVIQPTYGPVEGYLLHPRMLRFSPVAYYPTVFLEVVCVEDEADE